MDMGRDGRRRHERQEAAGMEFALAIDRWGRREHSAQPVRAAAVADADRRHAEKAEAAITTLTDRPELLNTRVAPRYAVRELFLAGGVRCGFPQVRSPASPPRPASSGPPFQPVRRALRRPRRVHGPPRAAETTERHWSKSVNSTEIQQACPRVRAVLCNRNVHPPSSGEIKLNDEKRMNVFLADVAATPEDTYLLARQPVPAPRP